MRITLNICDPRVADVRICRYVTLWLLSASLILGGGCKGIPTEKERQARTRLQSVGRNLAMPSPTMPQGTNVSLADLLSFALRNQPTVAAAYFDYAAAVEQITVERSLPDPRLSFELDIQEVVMSLMPGLMVEVPWMRRLRVSADVASMEADAKYYVFEQEVLQTAFDVKRAYYQLYFLERRLGVLLQTNELLAEIESSARALMESGSGTLQDILRAQIERDRIRTDIENTQDSRNALLARFKAALGLPPAGSEPPLPIEFEVTPATLPFEELYTLALRNNPRLRQMRAEVEMASASMRLARLSRVPDFSLGLEADVKPNPAMWRPSFGMTLPIWKDKIAAEIASAQARKSAAAARLSAEQIQLAVEFAEAALKFREASRTITLLSEQLLPKARQSMDVARTSYSSARASFLDLLDAERQYLEFRLAEIEARTERELAAAELQLLLAAVTPNPTPAAAP